MINNRNIEASKTITHISTDSRLYKLMTPMAKSEIILDKVKTLFEEFKKDFKNALENITANNLWIECDKVYYVPKFQMIVEKSSSYPNSGYASKLCGINTVCFTYAQAKELFYTKKNQLPQSLINAMNNSKKYNGNSWVTCDSNNGCVNPSDGTNAGWGSGDSDKIRIASAPMTKGVFIQTLIGGNWVLVNDDKYKSFNAFIDAFKKRNVVINMQGTFAEREFIEKATFDNWELINDKKYNLLNSLLNVFKKHNIMPAIKDVFFNAEYNNVVNQLIDVCDEFWNLLPESDRKIGTMNDEMFEDLIETVLSADEVRADLEPDDRKCVEDINRGHWELWDEKESGQMVELPKPLVARNPVADIRPDGLIGIDFGTKSTIVSCQDGSDKTKLLRIGIGELSKKAERYHYENPTILEFIDIETFLNDYSGEKGRPHTSFVDLYVSHRAANNFKDSSDSGKFYSYFYDIKQWCGSNERYSQIKIIDQNGNIKLLPPYLELEGEFDPVAIYAYYLGLFINNMRNGIYMNYILSFPAMYSKAARDKMLESFRTGLKKSLPDAVLENEEIMKEFSVVSGISEPEAYAITALKSYGFEPEGDEKIYYGIFDFGGGTTDYDFGIWREADFDNKEEELYDYVIRHIENGGDKYLGGENLLEKLAFEVFKANADKLRKNDKSAGFSFCKPVDCDDFPGSEILISSSQEARRNTKTLMEALRPFWEGLHSYDGKKDLSEENIVPSILAEDEFYELDSDCTIIKDGFVKVTLFDKEGTPQANFQLDIDNEKDNIKVDLLGILENEIDKGVYNFFEAMKPIFERDDVNTDSVGQVQIFIAGNSGKSPILQTCFHKYIPVYTKMLKGETKDEFFVIFPSLGTPEAIEIQKNRGIETDEEDILMPTGKTGVAYGLIEGRSGGQIKVESDQTHDKEAKFKYYLGIAQKNKFICRINRNIEYNEWYELIRAGRENFELYYSTLPESVTNRVPSDQVSKKRLKISHTDVDAKICIRAVSPTEIEYVVFKNEELCPVVRVELT